MFPIYGAFVNQASTSTASCGYQTLLNRGELRLLRVRASVAGGYSCSLRGDPTSYRRGLGSLEWRHCDDGPTNKGHSKIHDLHPRNPDVRESPLFATASLEAGSVDSVEHMKF